MKAPSIIECHPMNWTPEQLKQRRQLCDDLYWLIQQDKDIAEEILDEYVYHLSDNRVDELITLCNNELEDDWWFKLILQAELSDHFW